MEVFPARNESPRFPELPQPGVEPVPPALEGWSPNHWATREVPGPSDSNDALPHNQLHPLGQFNEHF